MIAASTKGSSRDRARRDRENQKEEESGQKESRREEHSETAWEQNTGADPDHYFDGFTN